MAYSSAALSASYLARLAADKPLAVGNNRLRGRTQTTAQWRSTGSWASGSDGTDAVGVATRVFDGYAHDLRSYPGSSVDPWYFIMDLGSGGVTIDSAAILNHNLADIAGMVVTLQFADDNAFTSNLITVASWTPSTSTKRLTSFALFHTGSTALRYSAVRWARFVFNPTAGSIPEIGEIILGQRRQFPHAPDEPFDPDAQKSYGVAFRAASRVRTLSVHAKGQRTVDATLTVDNSTDAAEALSLYEDDTEFGTLSWLWVPNPSTASQDAYLVSFDDEPEFSAPYTDGGIRQWSFSAEELPTFVSAEA